MNKYEVMYILDPALEDQPRKDLMEKFSALITSDGGSIEKIDDWGKRRLAYTIDYKTEGFYVLMTFSAKPDLPRELERNFQISDSVVRYLVTRLEDEA